MFETKTTTNAVLAGCSAGARRATSGLVGAALLSLAAAGSIGGAVPATAAVPNATSGQVWAGCVLRNNDTIPDIRQDIANNSGGKITNGSLDVAFIVVYSVANDNDGQPVVGGGYTGPIICINPTKVGIATTAQTAATPAAGAPPAGTGATTVDTLDAEDVFLLRYVLKDGPNAGTKEKILCHSVNDKINCFRISPLL